MRAEEIIRDPNNAPKLQLDGTNEAAKEVFRTISSIVVYLERHPTAETADAILYYSLQLSEPFITLHISNKVCECVWDKMPDKEKEKMMSSRAMSLLWERVGEVLTP